MAAASTRSLTITYTGDVTGSEVISAAANSSSPASIEIKTLTTGANTITVPTGGSAPTAVTIFPPSGNATSITFKGVSGDTGVRIHNTDPTSIALHSSVTSFVLTVGADITGVRLYWS